jgi:hypothetical protein
MSCPSWWGDGEPSGLSGQVASTDRNQIKTQIQAQTGAKEVIIRSVRS